MNHEFQKKLFMVQDPPEGNEQWERGIGANRLRWNPFLEHFGVPLDYKPVGIRIRREHLRKHDHAEASWKRMFLSYPTRMAFKALFDGRFIIDDSRNCSYHSKVKAENMELLMEADRGCYHHDHHGGRSKRNHFIIHFWDWSKEPAWKLPENLPEKRLRSNEELQSMIIENEG